MRSQVLSKLTLALTLIFILFLSGQMSAQSSLSGQVVQPVYAVPFAQVRICPSTAIGIPCFPTLTTVYSDPGFTRPVSNPYTSDKYGNYSLFVPPGLYIVQIMIHGQVVYSYLTYGAGGSGGGGGSGNATSIQGVPVSPTLPTVGQCLTVAAGPTYIPGSCSGSSSANQSVSFVSATVAALTIAGSTPNITWSCWDNSVPFHSIEPASVTVNPLSFIATFTFATPQSGYCAVNSSGGGGGGGGGGGTVTNVDGTSSQGAETVIAGGTVASITTFGSIRGSIPFVTQPGGDYLFADTDRGHFLLSADSVPDTYTLPTPVGTTFQNGWYVTVKNGSTTSPIAFTPVIPTLIDGLTSISLPAHTEMQINSDGTNYHSTFISPVGNNAPNLVWASPTGSSGLPSMRSLVSADIPWTAPGTIGSVTPNTGAFTTLIGTTIDGLIGSITPAAATFTSESAIDTNGVAHSERYPQTTVAQRANACLADAAIAANGAFSHICDSRGELDVQTIDVQINVGDGSSHVVAWMLPPLCDWTTTINDGVSAAIKQFNETNIIGSEPPLRCQIINGSPANGLYAVYLVNANGYERANGFLVASKNNTVASGGVMKITSAFDLSTWSDIEVDNYKSGNSGLLLGVTGDVGNSAIFNRITVYNNNQGGPALDIQANTAGQSNGLYFFGGSFGHPVAGQPNIRINDTSNVSGSDRTSIGFYGIYLETNTADVGNTPTIQITGANNVFFDGITIKGETAGYLAPAFSLNGTYATAFSVRGLYMEPGGGGSYVYPAIAVQNNIVSTTCPSTPCLIMTDAKGNLTQYNTSITYGDNFVAVSRFEAPYFTFDESAAGLTPVVGKDLCRGSTTTHTINCSFNGGSEVALLTAGTTIGIPGVVNITPVTANANVTTDQPLQEISLAANYLNSLNQPFTIDASGVDTIGAGQTPTLTYKVKLCTVSGCGSGTVVTLLTMTSAATTTATANPWRILGNFITNAIGVTGSLSPSGNLIADIGASPGVAQSVYQDPTPGTASATIDLTGPLFLDFTVATSAGSALNSFTQATSMVVPQSNVANAGVITSFPYFSNGILTSGTFVGFTLNQVSIKGFTLPYQVTTSTITYSVVTIDNSANLYDIGVYNYTTGALICHVGATAGTTFAPSAGVKSLTWTGGPVTLPANKYFIGITSNGAVATLGSIGNAFSFNAGSSGGTSTGGVLNPTITPPADVWASGTGIPSFVLR